MTYPEFISALQHISDVREWMRPKTAEEMHAMESADVAARQAKALEAKMRKKTRGGGS